MTPAPNQILYLQLPTRTCTSNLQSDPVPPTTYQTMYFLYSLYQTLYSQLPTKPCTSNSLRDPVLPTPTRPCTSNSMPDPALHPPSQLFNVLCNGGQHYATYRWLLISNKLCDSTLCTCGGVGGGEEQVHNVDPGCIMYPGDKH